MKVLNVILCVLILIMAAASAASAYLLFAKRAQMVEGWRKLATSIQQSAVEMDKNSGTKVAKDLSVEALAHSNYDTLDSKLGKLKTQAQQLVAERDALADAVRRVGRAVDMKNLPELGSLTGIATSSAATNDVINSVGDFKNRRDQLVSQIVSAAGKVNARINKNDLLSGDIDAAFRNFDNRIAAIQSQYSAYQSSVRLIASDAGAGSPDFSDSAYDASLKRVVSSVRELKGKLAKALAEVNDVKRQLNQANNTIKSRDGQIETLNSTIGRKDAEIAQYRKTLGLEPNQEFKPWEAGSPDAQRMVVGKVIEVNRKFGFIAVNLGKNSVVYQQIGTKKSEVNPMLDKGMVMLVARNVDSPDVKYIGKIKLVTVDNDCSIAESSELAPDAKIEVGDDVFFPESKLAPSAK